MPHIQFFSLLRLLLKRDALEIPGVAGDTVASVLERAQQHLGTPFMHKLLDAQGTPHAGTIILVNRRNILHLQGLQTPVGAGDTLACFPPGAGG